MDEHSRETAQAVGPWQSLPTGLACRAVGCELLVQLFISCCSILCSLLPRALQEPAPEQEALSLQEPQAPLPPRQQVSQDAEAVRGGCTGVVESPFLSGDIGLPVLDAAVSCVCEPGAEGAQRCVLAWRKLTVSVQMSPIAQKSNVSPWCFHLDWPSCTYIQIPAPPPSITQHPTLLQTPPPSHHPPSRLASRHPGVSCTGWAPSPSLVLAGALAMASAVTADRLALLVVLGSCSCYSTGHMPLLPQAVGEELRPGAGYLLCPQERDPLGNEAGSWG